MEPYISINRLATRRKAIVNSYKEGQGWTGYYYQIVYATVGKYFKAEYDKKILQEALTSIKDDPDTSWTKTDIENSKLALECLQSMKLPNLKNYKITSSNPIEISSFIMKKVKVTIKPDLYLTHVQSGKIGAIKVNITKTPANRLDKPKREFAATLIKYGLMEMGYRENQIDNKACISVDVFEKGYDSTPGSYKRKVNELSDACEEFALRWESL